jgi:REP element-mobilizing transposase RayT
MSLPRQVVPGRAYLITRRCTQRQFLMRPDRETNNAFIYCLAFAAQRTGVRVLFTMAMSNHHHTGIEDPHGNYPAFLELFHKLFAKCQNALRGRWENFWASEQTSVVRLVDPNDIVEKMVYALTNPVKDRLVEKARHWPGASSLEALANPKPLTATRPRHFFREDGGMPATISLDVSSPKAFEGPAAKEFVNLVVERIAVIERDMAAERHRTGTTVLGRRGVLAQTWSARPATAEPRRVLDPTVAARSKWSRIEALLRNRAFRAAYAAAREAFVAGIRDVLFPAGTYWLRLFAHAPCAEDDVTVTS